MSRPHPRTAGRTRWLLLAGLVATSLGGVAAWAQTAPPTPAAPPAPAAADEAEHAALRQFKALFEKAVNENNMDLMKPHLHEPFSVVTYTDREFKDFEAFKARWQKTREELLGSSGRYSLTLDPDRSEIFGDIAVAHGNSDNVMVTPSGDEHRFASHWTVVFRKVDGQWKIVRAHNSLNPFDNPMLRTAVRKLVIQYSGGALVVGAILGGAVGFWLSHRRRPAPATA
jgi:ketosteroid isomerase-like protein